LATVQVLVEYGAKLEARDESQQTPKDVAERFKHKAISDYLVKEAPAISVVARKKYAALEAGDQALVMDPIMEAVQNNEELNLERILSTASKVVSEKGSAPVAPIISPAKQRQRQFLFGIFMFSVTLLVGMALGRRGGKS